MINQSLYGFGGAFAVSGQYGSGLGGFRSSDSYNSQLSSLFGNPSSNGCGPSGGFYGYGMSGSFSQGWSSAFGNSCHNYLNCLPNYSGQSFGCYPPNQGYGGCNGLSAWGNMNCRPQPCPPQPCPPQPCSSTTTEQTHKMWDVWFDTERGQETVQITPIILDLNGNGKADITGKNILGDGKIDGPVTMFDMDPDNISYQFQSQGWRPGLGLPATEGAYWIDANGKRTNQTPPGGDQVSYAGWKYVDANGQRLGEMKSDGQYHYGVAEKHEKTEWLAKDGGDAFLVADYNRDGQINDATELFGTSGPNGQKYKNGYEKLAALHDTNKDGVVSGKELEGLQIWKDSNADGVAQKGELLSLTSQGISSFDVRTYNNDTMEGSYKTTSSTPRVANSEPLPYMSYSFSGAFAGFGVGSAYSSSGFGGFSPYFNSFTPSFGFSAPWMGYYQ